MVKQCFIIFGCLAVGEIIVWLTGISIPGSILGMLLMTFLLEKKLLKVEDVAPMCRFLVSNMGFFFVPPGVALMLYFDVIADSWLAITVATVVSTALVLLVTGRVHQLFRHGFHRK
ncbi:MAG: CidA/LrgA family protein [Duncaniella sp.]|jgi:holin-like protein|uniref:CidA/LrgA family protein n=1 Tax=Duncaniella muricolitica TaxID=2880704 RepID=UPI000AEED76E|nr:CidA/LrgA family protein [Duncaniella muricolitica]MCX4369814.1 CidA/LrgA family protein [Duncaniella sp.]ROT19770.1 CidA/LrgA family protein [Muribaculaceae bacterium Isolate-110 (HZI)]